MIKRLISQKYKLMWAIIYVFARSRSVYFKHLNLVCQTYTKLSCSITISQLTKLLHLLANEQYTNKNLTNT